MGILNSKLTVTIDRKDFGILLFALMGLCVSRVDIEGKPKRRTKYPVIIRYDDIRRVYDNLLKQLGE